MQIVGSETPNLCSKFFFMFEKGNKYVFAENFISQALYFIIITKVTLLRRPFVKYQTIYISPVEGRHGFTAEHDKLRIKCLLFWLQNFTLQSIWKILHIHNLTFVQSFACLNCSYKLPSWEVEQNRKKFLLSFV